MRLLRELLQAAFLLHSQLCILHAPLETSQSAVLLMTSCWAAVANHRSQVSASYRLCRFFGLCERQLQRAETRRPAAAVG